jgi:HEAT repeat protein
MAQDSTKPDGVQPDGLKNLRHPDANVRYRTAALLAKQGPAAKYAIAELHEALSDTDPLVRVKVAEAIWKVERPGPGVILPTLNKALKDQNAEVRAAACGAIGMLGAKGKAAVPVLVEALKDKDVGVVLAAVSALGDVGPAAKDSAPNLLALAGYPDFIILEPIVGAALAGMGEAVVPVLAAALKEASPERRRVAAYALGSMGPEARGAVKALSLALRDETWAVRTLAARALGAVGKEAQAALPRLRDATADPDPMVRIRAALAVWQVGGETKYVEPLARALEDETAGVREAGCQALAAMGPDAKTATPALARALTDKESIVRQAAAEALGKIGPAAAGEAAALRGLMKDADKAVRVSGAYALWQVTGQAKDSLEVLRNALSDSASLRAHAVTKLGGMGPEASDALPELVAMYREEDGEAMRRGLADAIKRIDPDLAAKLGIR